MNESLPQGKEGADARLNGRRADCAACRLVGAGGCFAGAWYALFQRARLPANNRNRHWLGAIAVGEYNRELMNAGSAHIKALGTV